MKNSLFLILLFGIFISACSDDAQTIQGAEVAYFARIPVLINDIPILDSGETMTVKSTVVQVASDDSFAKYNVNPSNIKSTQLKQMDIFTQDFCKVDLSFLNSVKIYIESDGQAPKLIAERDSISKTAGGIGWTVQLSDDLSDYLKNGSFWLNMEFETDEKTNELGFLRLTPRFSITATTGD